MLNAGLDTTRGMLGLCFRQSESYTLEKTSNKIKDLTTTDKTNILEWITASIDLSIEIW